MTEETQKTTYDDSQNDMIDERDGGRQDIKYYIFPLRRFWYI